MITLALYGEGENVKDQIKEIVKEELRNRYKIRLSDGKIKMKGINVVLLEERADILNYEKLYDTIICFFHVNRIFYGDLTETILAYYALSTNNSFKLSNKRFLIN